MTAASKMPLHSGQNSCARGPRDMPGILIVQVELGRSILIEVVQSLVPVGCHQLAVLQEPVEGPGGQVEDDLAGSDVLHGRRRL